MRKWVLLLQLEPGQEVFFLFGDKDKETIMKGKCIKITIGEDKIPKYTILGGKCVYSKAKIYRKGEVISTIFICKNCNINTGDEIGAWPVFTSQEAYKEWRNKKK